MMKTYAVLELAAARIDGRGWTQGKFSGGELGDCAVTAIWSFSRDPIHTHLFAQYLGIYGLCEDGEQFAITRWNDSSMATKARVTAALRACAAIEKAKEAADAIEVAGPEVARADGRSDGHDALPVCSHPRAQPLAIPCADEEIRILAEEQERDLAEVS